MFPFSLFKRKQKLQPHRYVAKPSATHSVSTGRSYTSSQPVVIHNHYHDDYGTYSNADTNLIDTLIATEVMDEIINRNNSSYDSGSYITNNDSYYGGGGDSGGAGASGSWDSGSSSYDSSSNDYSSSSSDFGGGGGDFGGGGSSSDW